MYCLPVRRDYNQSSMWSVTVIHMFCFKYSLIVVFVSIFAVALLFFNLFKHFDCTLCIAHLRVMKNCPLLCWNFILYPVYWNMRQNKNHAFNINGQGNVLQCQSELKKNQNYKFWFSTYYPVNTRTDMQMTWLHLCSTYRYLNSTLFQKTSIGTLFKLLLDICLYLK